MTKWKIEVAGVKELVSAQNKTNRLLQELIDISNERTELVADSLQDIRGNLVDLGVDVDAALNAIQQGRQELADALANQGVDQAARDEIMGLIDAQQARIVSALNPEVPVDPDTPPADPNDFPHPDQTLPGDLA